MQLGSKVLIILVSAMLLMAMAGEATAYTPVVKVSLIPIFGTLNGYVKTSGGDAVSGATVAVWDMEDNPQGSPVTTDSHGFYSIGLVGGSSYYVAANRSDLGLSSPATVSVTANTVTSQDLTFYTKPTVIFMTPAKSTIMANGSDTVKVTIHMVDAFSKVPGDTGWGWINLKIGDASPTMIDPSQFTNGAYTFTCGPIPSTTTATSVLINLNTTGLPVQIVNVVTLNIVKPTPSPSPTPTTGPSPSAAAPTVTPTATPSAASPSPAANTPTVDAIPIVSLEPVNATAVAGQVDVNGTGPVQSQTSGSSSSNESMLIYIIGGLLLVITFMLGVGATYFLLQKKK